MTIEKKDSPFTFELKAVGDDTMLIEGYGSTFGGEPDAYRDLIAKGAFLESIREFGVPKMLYQHDQRRIPGVWDHADEDSKGLYLRGHFIDTALGKDAHIEAKSGALTSMSIGYSTTKFSWDEETDVRTIITARLWEVSLVTFPANANALITQVKNNAPGTVREFERLLRDAGGYSREQAKAIALDGFKAIDGQRDAEPDLKALSDVLTNFKTLIS